MRPPHPQIAIVAIDETSLRAIGRWPWPRTLLADLVERLSGAGAAAVALDILLNAPENSGEQQAVQAIAVRLAARGLDPAVRRELERVAREADRDARLAAAIRDSGRVILSSNFLLSALPGTGPPAREGAPMKSAIGAFKNYPERWTFPPFHADRAAFPIPPLRAEAVGIGHVNHRPPTGLSSATCAVPSPRELTELQ